MSAPLPGGRPGAKGWALRLAWFAGLWLAGVAAVGAVALVVRAVLRP